MCDDKKKHKYSNFIIGIHNVKKINAISVS